MEITPPGGRILHSGAATGHTQVKICAETLCFVWHHNAKKGHRKSQRNK